MNTNVIYISHNRKKKAKSDELKTNGNGGQNV